MTEDVTQVFGRLAAGIDDILEAEMSSALQTVDGSGPPVAGDLADVDLPFLLGRLFAEGSTGRLVVRRDEQEKAIYFESGLPVMACSSDPADRMLAMLVRDGKIAPSQREAASRQVDSTGRKIGAVLVELGLLRSDELLPAVRRHYESVILSLFSWLSGQWLIEPGITAGPDRTRLLRHPVALVRDGLSLGYPNERIVSRLGSGRNVFIFEPSGSAADLLEHAALEGAEARVPLLFDGGRTLDDVTRVSGLPESTVWQVAFALTCFGALRSVGTPSREGPRLGVRDLQIERERVLSRYALAQEGTYFEVLGVDGKADAAEIRRAYQRLVKETAAECLGPELTCELRPQIGAIRTVLDEALRVLLSPVLRSAYETAMSVRSDPQVPAADHSASNTET